MPRRTRFVIAALVAAAFAAAPLGSATAAPGGAQGAAADSSGESDAALTHHKPAGTGSGRKIG
jgi:hypothetical protein